MKTFLAVVGLAVTLYAAPAFAQDISGQWQGTLHAGQELRAVVKISKDSAGGFKADIFSIDQSPEPIGKQPVTLIGSTIKFAVPDYNASFEGQLSADHKTIKGIYTQGLPLPLELVKATKATAWVTDPSPHAVSFVTTTGKVKLEVLDWGGTGRPLVFIPGLGATAHVFDKFALQFAGKYHVYGVTRRGFGASDHPDPASGANYMADRLGDDVLTAIDALKLDRPTLAAWSLGGEEMSSIATRHPGKVSGLIYLDAAYAYGFYAPGNVVPAGSNLQIDMNDIRAKIDSTRTMQAAEASAVYDRLQKIDVPQLQADLAAAQAALAEIGPIPQPGKPPPETLQTRIVTAIMAGEQKYTEIKAPILAIFAVPAAVPANADDALRAFVAKQSVAQEAQVKRFEAANPAARVVRLANAQHAVFNSNPGDVVREMNAFLEGLE